MIILILMPDQPPHFLDSTISERLGQKNRGPKDFPCC
jgi:hypothetical protein